MVVICDRDVCLFCGQSVVLFVGDIMGIGASRFRRKSLFWIVLSDSDRWDEAGNPRSRCPVGKPAGDKITRKVSKRKQKGGKR